MSFTKRKSNLLLFFGYIVSTVLLTASFSYASIFLIIMATLFGDPTPIYFAIFVIPQVIILPIFYYFYQKDNGRVTWLEKSVLVLILFIVMYWVLFVMPR